MEYVVKTNKGYMKGDMHRGITFTRNKSEARSFTEVEAILYKESIYADLFQFYEVETAKFEQAEVK